MVETSDPWFNDQAYVDTLNPAAIRKFVDVTYEAYFKSVGDEFNKTAVHPQDGAEVRTGEARCAHAFHRRPAGNLPRRL